MGRAEDVADLRNFAPKRAAERHYTAAFEATRGDVNAQLSKATPHQARCPAGSGCDAAAVAQEDNPHNEP